MFMAKTWGPRSVNTNNEQRFLNSKNSNGCPKADNRKWKHHFNNYLLLLPNRYPTTSRPFSPQEHSPLAKKL